MEESKNLEQQKIDDSNKMRSYHPLSQEWQCLLIEIGKKRQWQIVTRNKNSVRQWKIASSSGEAVVNVYDNGTILIQGTSFAMKKEVAALLLGNENLVSSKSKTPPAPTVETHTSNIPKITEKEWIGMDEVGKGDYFGPLVTAAVCIPKSQEERLRHLGIKDSKEITDPTIIVLANTLRSEFAHYVFVLWPKDYNMIYATIGNQNRLLAQCHAQSLENLLTIQKADLAICDQFSQDPYVLKNALLPKGRILQLIQVPHGERDTAVAFASILARATFLEKMDEMSLKFQMEFPKGSTSKITSFRDEFIRKHGKKRLHEVAKLHFNLQNLYNKQAPTMFD